MEFTALINNTLKMINTMNLCKKFHSGYRKTFTTLKPWHYLSLLVILEYFQNEDKTFS